MRRWRLSGALLVLVVVFGLSVSSGAQACTCVKRRDAASVLKDAEHLVLARVTRVQYQRAWIGEARVWGDIEILETLKESAGLPLARVWSEREIPACAIPLIVGQVYVFSPWGDDDAQVNRCSSWAVGAGDVEGDRLLRQIQAIREEQRRRAREASSRVSPAASSTRR